MVSCILALLTGAVVLVTDQITKNYFVANFELFETRSAIPYLFDFTYIHNTGGAWGIMGAYPWVLLCVALIVSVVCIILMINYRKQSKLMFWALSLVLSGGLGNIIDRVFRSHHSVVDFIDLSFIDFPVFNIADCAVCIGAGLLVLYFVIDMVKTGKKEKTGVINNE